jgi:hypothetical protein
MAGGLKTTFTAARKREFEVVRLHDVFKTCAARWDNTLWCLPSLNRIIQI